MRIDAITDAPKALYDGINKAMNDGDLKTWEIVKNDKDEILYSHTPAQWAQKAMLKPSIQKDRLRLSITWWKKNEEPATEVKGYILGRFTEVLMVHFGSNFTKLETL